MRWHSTNKLVAKAALGTLAICVAARAAGGHRFLLITGGWSPTSNNERYERYIRIFNNAFGNRATVLFGGGDNSPMVPQDRTERFDRDDWGGLRIVPSSLTGIRPGTSAEAQQLFSEVVAEQPDAVTAVFGDHGGQDGVAMWNQTILTGEQVNSWYHRFPESTVVRSLHLHCYGGAVVVPKRRTLPTRFDQVPQFLRDYYPRNKCALAASSEDEVSYSLGSFSTIENNPWTGFFRDNPRPSLQRVKEFLATHPQVSHLPVMTSDYFVKDMTSFLCRDVATTGAPRPPTHGSGAGGRPVDTRDEDVCRASSRAGLDAATARLLAQDEVTDDVHYVIREMVGRFIRANNLQYNDTGPDGRPRSRPLYDAFREAKLEVDRMLADIARQAPLATAMGRSPEQIAPFLAMRIERLRNGPILAYQRLVSSIADGETQRPAFLAFVNSEGERAYMNSADFVGRHPSFVETRRKREHAGRNLFEIDHAESTVHMNLQTTRRRLGLARQAAERAFVERRLAVPGMEDIRSVYESITRCERTPIN